MLEPDVKKHKVKTNKPRRERFEGKCEGKIQATKL
jgi:hypothetical protein